MKRKAIAAALATLAVAGCGGDTPQGARLTVTVVGDATRPQGYAQRLAREATLPTLIARDGAGQIVPGLASSWRFVDDGRSLILRLRPVKWSNGQPLVSGDVVAAFRNDAVRRDPLLVRAGLENAADIIAGHAPVARLGVAAPISRVVEVRLATASPLLLSWLAEPGLAVTRPKEPAVTLADYVARGPAQRQLLRRRTMVASPGARPAEIVISAGEDGDTAVADFVRGDTDIVIGDGLAGLGVARTSAPAQTLRIDPVWGIYGYLMNSKRDALRDPAIRLALAMSVNRAALLQRFGITAMTPVEAMMPPSLDPVATAPASGGGFTALATSVVPNAVSGAVSGAVSSVVAGVSGTARQAPAKAAAAAAAAADASRAADWRKLAPDARLAKARAIMDSAGYSADSPLRLVLLLPPGREHRTIAESVGADWARINVVIAVSEVEAGTIDRLVARGAFDLAVTEDSVPVPDPLAGLARWRCSRSGPWCDPSFDALFAAATAAKPADRPVLTAAAAGALAAAPPMVSLFTPIRWALVGRNVDGWTANAAGSHPLARLAVNGR